MKMTGMIILVVFAVLILKRMCVNPPARTTSVQILVCGGESKLSTQAQEGIYFEKSMYVIRNRENVVMATYTPVLGETCRIETKTIVDSHKQNK